MHPQHQDELLSRHLQALLGDVEPAALELLRQRLQWVVLPGGATLMSQGEPGDSMFITISGRLRAYVRGADGVERMVREMARGQVIGEMSLYTDEPRSATVVAIRDSVLVRLDKADFQTLLATSPKVSLALTRQVIRRLQSPQQRSDLARPVALALLPVSARVDLSDFAQGLGAALQAHGRVCVVDAEAVDLALATPGLARSAAQDEAANRRIALHLDALEAGCEYLLLVADDTPSAWTERCSRRCDELLLVAWGAEPPALHPIETQVLMRRTGRSEAVERLVLLHPADTALPRGTGAWLDRRPLSGPAGAACHVHVRPGLPRDMARLARIQSQTAVGLVLAGGGARGLAHLGVMQALAERGIEVDFVVGTSIGGVMAALAALDRPLAEVMPVARAAFAQNPTGDYSLLPLLSLVKGQRLRRVVQAAMQQLMGREPDAEDLWKNFACVASNYSQAGEVVIRRGPLMQAMMASMAIPGALPPVIRDGELLCDGGTFNNFPVDVMRRTLGVGTIVGVDLAGRKRRRIEHADIPGPWALLRDRLRPRAKQRYRLPTLMAYLMNVTVLYSSSRQEEARRMTDVYLNPPLERVGMLQWDKFDSIVQQGREHALAVLDAQGAQGVRAAA